MAEAHAGTSERRCAVISDKHRSSERCSHRRCREAGFLEIEFALQQVQDLVTDHPVAAQFDETAPFGGEGNEAQAAHRVISRILSWQLGLLF